MKTKNRDEYDANHSLFAVASGRRHHPFSKTTHFAEIAFGIAEAPVVPLFSFALP